MLINKYFYVLCIYTLGCSSNVFIEPGDVISLDQNLKEIETPFYKAIAEVNKALPALKLKASFYDDGDWSIKNNNSIKRSSLTKYDKPIIYVNLKKWKNWVDTNEWIEIKDQGLQDITYVMFMHELWHGLGFRWAPEHLSYGFMKKQILISDTCINQDAVDILCNKRPEICGGNAHGTCEE